MKNNTHWPILWILTLRWRKTNHRACHQEPFVTWYFLRKSKAGRRIIALAPCEPMCACTWCEYLCVFSRRVDSLCGVRLKPKLPGPVVDSHVSPTHCPRGSKDQDHCSGSVCSHTWNTGLDYTGLKYDSSQRGGGTGRPFLLFYTHTHIHRHTHHPQWKLHHRLTERTLWFHTPAKDRCEE